MLLRLTYYDEANYWEKELNILSPHQMQLQPIEWLTEWFMKPVEQPAAAYTDGKSSLNYLNKFFHFYTNQHTRKNQTSDSITRQYGYFSSSRKSIFRSNQTNQNAEHLIVFDEMQIIYTGGHGSTLWKILSNNNNKKIPPRNMVTTLIQNGPQLATSCWQHVIILSAQKSDKKTHRIWKTPLRAWFPDLTRLLPQNSRKHSP